MVGIMDFFKNASSTEDKNKQQSTDNSNNSNNKQQDGKENLSQNPPTTTVNGKMPGTEPGNENPLDVYKKMFENAASNTPEEAPKFAIDPKVLGDVSGKMDFTRGINQETLQKATSGDVNALMDIIKKVGQNAYRASIEHNTALTDTFINQRSDFEGKKIKSGVRQELTSSALASTPNYQHPVVKQELNRIASQFAAANPDASPQEVAQAAKKYIDDLQSALNPSTDKKDDEKNGEMDWSKYLA
jgi:hypothetical protein